MQSGCLPLLGLEDLVLDANDAEAMDQSCVNDGLIGAGARATGS